MYLSKLKIYLFFVSTLLLALTVVSCESLDPLDIDGDEEKENFLISMFDDDDEDYDDDEKDHFDDCFHIIYPISIAFPDSTTTTFDNEETLFDALEIWYQNAPDDFDPEIIFPIEVELYGDEKITITADEELYALYEACEEKWEDEEWYDDHDDCEIDDWITEGLSDCYDVQYPISIKVDSTVYTLSSEEEIDSLIEVVDDMYDDLESINIELIFPITVIDGETNEVITIENESDIVKRSLQCAISSLCFDFNYPITFLLGGGDTHDVNNDDELIDKIILLGANYDALEEIPFVPSFPISVTFDNGDVVEANDLEKLEDIFEECDD